MKDDQEKLNITTRIMRLLLWLSLIAGAGLIAASYWLFIPYGYGEQYYGVLSLLWLLVPASIFMVFTKISTKLLSASGAIGRTSIIQIVSAGVGIVLYFLLIRPYGIMGAALATSVSYLTGAGYSFYILNKAYGLQLRNWFVLQKSDVTWALSSFRKNK
jgi:O-antigen/teichoic acid export membrane protein